MAHPGVGNKPLENREFDVVELRVQIDDHMGSGGGGGTEVTGYHAGISEMEYEFTNQKYIPMVGLSCIRLPRRGVAWFTIMMAVRWGTAIVTRMRQEIQPNKCQLTFKFILCQCTCACHLPTFIKPY